MPELTYSEVGASNGELPSGYHHVRASREIGHGRAVFEAASSRLLSWGMHEGAGVHKVAGPDEAILGADVAFSWIAIRFECRVVSAVDETDRQGFAYGTLPRHPECGEESFLITFDDSTQTTTATITAFSKPASHFVRLAGPLARLIQKRMTHRYLDSLTCFH